MTVSSLSLLLIGCGRMGGALLQGWTRKGASITPYVIDPHRPKDLPPELVADWYSKLADLPADFTPDIVLFAIKPQLMDAVVPECAVRGWDNALWMSIAAGTRTGYFTTHLGKDAPVIRVMPNTPALISRGISALFATDTVTSAQRDSAEQLMQAVGAVLWLDDEQQMDAFTGLAGSGPAYVFYMIEAMTEAGINAGLDRDMAARAALLTVQGAAELAVTTGTDPAALREQVTSPGGTTAAGLAVLMHERKGLMPLMKDVVLAAAKRAKEL